MSVSTPQLPVAATQSTGLLPTLLTMSLTAVALLRPRYAEDGRTIQDFDWVYLNPAGQRMLGQPEQPPASLLTLFPAAKDNAHFATYRQAFETGQAQRHQTNYQADGVDGYFLVVAQRCDDLLVVNFTDTNEQPRSAVETALRESQAREQAALAEAERQRALLYRVFEQAPAMICILQGPEYVFEFVNPPYRALMGDRPLLGRPLAEALPELAGQGIYEALDHLYRTGESIYASEWLAQLAHDTSSPAELEKRYYNFVWQARRDLAGAIDGVLVFAYDVTPQVLARHQVQTLNEELAASNAELTATNAEYRQANGALEAAQQQLHQLNAELEARVQARTQEALAPQADLLAAAQRQVQAHESFYQVFEQTPAAVSLLRGPSFRFEYVNPIYQQVFAGRQLVGRDFAEALPDAAAQGFLALLEGVYQTGETFFGAEVPFVSEQPDAPAYTTYFNFTYQAYRENGELVGISTFALDVTEQVLARQEREAQRRRLYALFEQAPVGVCILAGPELVFEFVNPAYQRLLPGRALLNQPILAALPELAGTEVAQRLRQVYATGETHQAQEMRIPVARLDHPGELEDRYFTFVFQARRDEDNRVTGILNFVFEVTDQVLARRQADEAAADLRLLTAHSPAFLFRTDLAGNLVYLNKEFFAWTGLDAAQLRSLNEGWAAVHLGDIAEQQSSFVAAVQAGQPWQSTPYRFRRADGQYRWMLSRSQPLLGAEGQVLGHSGLTIEVHEQVELQQQLERTNVDLDTFVYTASHDLKAPITNIEGLLMALRHELPAAVQEEEMTHQLLDMIQGAVERFQLTITQLTDVSRLQHAQNQPAEHVPLAAVVEDVRLDLGPLLTSTQAQLTVEVDPDVLVHFSPKNLRSVVVNLLSNALKYHQPGLPPAVQLRAARQGQQVVLTVADNGLGMSEGQQRQLFGLFQRLHTHVEGTGVGLYMVKRLVENAGGTIAVQSQVGQGTTFTVTFPA